MAEHSILIGEIMGLMGLQDLDDAIQWAIYDHISGLLEKELEKKRNKRFGWNDSLYIDIEGDHPIDVHYVVTCDRRVIGIELDGFDGIFLSGYCRTCQKLERKIRAFVKKLPKKKILDKIAPELDERERTALEKWRKLHY